MRVDSYRLALTGSVVLAVLVGIADYSGFYPGPLSQLASVLTSAAALAAATLALKKYGFSPTRRFSSSWFLFALGMGCRVVGESGYLVSETLYNVPAPYPSAADAFSFAGFAMVFLGLLLYVRMFAKALTRTKVLTVAAVVVVAGAVAYTLLLGPSEIAEIQNLPSTVLTFTYATLEALALSTALLGFALFSGGRVGRSWLALIGATLVTMVGDLLYFYVFVNSSPALLPADSVVASWGYIMFALAFLIHRKEFG